MRIRLDVCIGCIIAGTVITVIGLSAALGGFLEATWEIMGRTIAPLVWAGLSQSLVLYYYSLD